MTRPHPFCGTRANTPSEIVVAPVISVLLVDDEPGLLDVSRIYLGRDGEYEVSCSSSGPEAISLLDKGHFDAIVSDYQMPGMDGIELLKQLRSNGNQIPFIIFTGRGREHVVIEAMNHGADFFLQKGGDPKAQFADLKNAIRVAVQRRRAEQALLQSEAMYRSIVENTGTACAIIEGDTTISLVNAYFAHISGYSREEIEGRMSWTSFVSPDDLARMKKYHSARRKANGRAPRNYEFGFVNRNGRIREMTITVGIIPGTTKSVASFLDITDRKKMETSLREREQVLRSFLDSIPDASIIIDKAGNGLYVNMAAVKLGGLSTPEEALSRSVFDFIHPSCTERVVQDLSTLREGPGSTRSEYLVRTADGSMTWMEGLGTGITFRGEPANLVTLRDITERKRIETTLQESEQRYKDFAELLPQIVFETDLSGKITFGNRKAFTICRYDQADFENGLNLYQMIVPEDRERIRNDIRRVCAGAQTAGTRCTIVRKDGTTFPARAYSAPVVRDGRTVGMRGIVVDLSEQQAAEGSLRESEGLLRNIMNNIPMGVFRSSAGDGKIVMANIELAGIFGYDSVGALMEVPILELYADPADRGKFIRHLRDHGHVGRLEIRFRRKDGSLILGRISATYLSTPEGGIDYIDGVIEDITREKAGEAERERLAGEVGRQGHLLDAIFGVTPVSLYVYDRECRFTYVSSTGARQIGMTPEEMIGKHWKDLGLPSTALEKIEDDVQSVFEKGKALHSQVTWPVATGVRIFEYEMVPMQDNSGRITSVVNTVIDVTERTRAENAGKQANRRLHLLSGITRHDILNQLTALRGYLELIETADAVQGRFLAQSKAAAGRIGEQILFTRDYQEIGMNAPQWQLVAGSVSAAADMIDAEGIDPACSAGDLEVFADPLLSRVFSNLIENSLRHGERVSQIRVTAHADGERLRIVYEDDGCGIP
ncbi:MAG: PAS domain S-box protein, partial [Methanoregulaceae archaeon]|nr:PAS domain S-box protein [Methanoregulaceae archaeon]